MEELRIIRPKNPASTPGSRSSSRELPDDLLQQSCGRLGWAALVYSLGYTLAFVPGHVIHLVTRPTEPGYESIPVLTAWVSILFGLVVGLVAWRRWLPCRNLLLWGCFFQVVAALGIGIGEEWGFYRLFALGKLKEITGISWICVWVIFMAAILPGKPRRAVLVGLATASMGPLAHYISWVGAGSPPLGEEVSRAQFILSFTPYYICVIMAYFISRILYGLGTDVSRAREFGSYSLVEQLGKGGMGEVWRAKHRLLARPAAIKLIRPDRVGGTGGAGAMTTLRRFEREAQATAALESPHTIQLFDFGITDDGVFYYVMELLHGFDMESLVERHGPVPAERAIHFLCQACHSLTDAHDQGLIHRDIKPANLFVCRLGSDYDFVKVLDFGLVKADAGAPFGDDTRLTREGIAGGTPAFMAPEVALGKGLADERLDIYSLGCVGYWLLTGQRVFQGATPMEMVVQHVQEAPIAPSKRTELPVSPALDAVVLACLAKSPEQRPASARELHRLLRGCEEAGRWSEERAEKWWQTHAPHVRRTVQTGEERTLDRIRKRESS
jgi:hypothetical protein